MLMEANSGVNGKKEASQAAKASETQAIAEIEQQ
jgi:hypothetical protein